MISCLRARRVAGFRSKRGGGWGLKTGAKKRVTSDQANESEAACAALDGERMGSGRLSMYESGGKINGRGN